MFHVEQSKLIDITECPICGSKESKVFLVSKDFSCSKEEFTIRECTSCEFRFTSPIPSENEIGAYYESEDYISHTDSNKGVMNKIYQTVRKKAIRQKYQLIDGLTKEKSLLDIGCGTGHFLEYVKGKKWTVKGLEPDADARAIGNEKGLQIEHTDQLHELPSKSFDVITMWHVLEHVYHLNRDMKRIVEVLKDDGALVVAVPNCSSYDAEKYGEHWAAYDLPIHLYHFRPKNIFELGDKHGLSIEKVLPMKFDSFYVSMLSEKYKGGSLPSAFFTGLKSNWKANDENRKYSSQIYVLRKKENVRAK